MTIRAFVMAAALAGFAVSGCSAPASNQTAAPQSAADHEASIRAATDRWLELVRNRDAAAIAQLYTEDGAMMPPDAPVSIGREAIEAAWRGMMEAPGFELTFGPEQIAVASGGDMALDRGTYRFAMDGPDGRITETGKYVVVWRNVGGEWKAAADIFNRDAAPAGQPPA